MQQLDLRSPPHTSLPTPSWTEFSLQNFVWRKLALCFLVVFCLIKIEIGREKQSRTSWMRNLFFHTYSDTLCEGLRCGGGGGGGVEACWIEGRVQFSHRWFCSVWQLNNMIQIHWPHVNKFPVFDCKALIEFGIGKIKFIINNPSQATLLTNVLRLPKF